MFILASNSRTTLPSNCKNSTQLRNYWDEDCDEVNTKTRERWLGGTRKVGLRDDVHLCAFLLDPIAQAALTSSRAPECDLLGGEVLDAARRVFKQLADNDARKNQVYVQQLTLYTAALPEKPVGAQEAQSSGNNAYSSSIFSQMSSVWKLKAQREVTGPTAGMLAKARTRQVTS